MRICALVCLALLASVGCEVESDSQGKPPERYKLLGKSFSEKDKRLTVDLTPPSTDYEGRMRALSWAVFDIFHMELEKWPLNEDGAPTDMHIKLWDSPKKKAVLSSIMVLPDVKTSEVMKTPKQVRKVASAKPGFKLRPKPKPVPKPKRSPRQIAVAKIKERCQRQMASYGASIVKVCVDEDIEAYDALARYPAKRRKIVNRCKRQMLSMGGWSIVKVCVDEDIDAAQALKQY